MSNIEPPHHSWHLYIIKVINEMWTISRNDIILKLMMLV